MAHDGSWPPVSPHAALLSSPSGREKYATYEVRSPMKRSATTPNLADRLRAARTGHGALETDGDFQEEVEEDEETLQLQLAAIEARLKLKKLQQSKAGAPASARHSSPPSSAHGSARSTVRPISRLWEPALDRPQVEVKVSPTKRLQPTQPKSPSRVLLGIDKGMKGADVSLRRAKTTAAAIRRTNYTSPDYLPGDHRPSSRGSAFNSARSHASSKASASVEIRKTFNERMSEARDGEASLERRRARINRDRRQKLDLDQAEIDSYRLAAEESHKNGPVRSPTRQYFEYSRDEVVHATAEANAGSRRLKKSLTMPDPRNTPSRADTQDSDILSTRQAESSLFEGFSHLHLSSRILPQSFLDRTLPSDKFTNFRIPDLLKAVKSPSFELPDSVCHYVVFAVIASKSSAMDQKKTASGINTVGNSDWEQQWEDGSKNQRRFMAFTLTDLTWTIDLYLFGTAVPRYHRLTPGTVVAILNPGIMPPKPGRSDTGAFSLSLSDGDDTVLEIGTARDLGYCKTVKKDGKECGSWINSAKTEICEWHLNAEINKTKAKRMGVNAGTSGFGSRRSNSDNGAHSEGGRGLLERGGRRYDRFTESQYYIFSTGPGGGAAAAGGRRTGGPQLPGSTQSLDDSDDLFAPGGDGQLARPGDRQARVRRHLAARAKEREIAEKLGSRDHAPGGFGGAGAEYLRMKARQGRGTEKKQKEQGSTAPLAADDEGGSQGSSALARGILSSGPPSSHATSRKRTAADVRLSPIKKTRFVTDKGIREAGRESLGGPATATDARSRRAASESEDDELEIV